jgi:hypothetical protein
MAFSFPPNPTLDQVYSNNGQTWKWNGVQWVSYAAPTPKGSPVYISVSPPANPVSGSLWYDSTNASLNIYYVDLNGGQWIGVVANPDGTLTTNGGVFQSPIYAQYEIPNNAAAFVTRGWVENLLTTYLSQNGYIKAGDGVTIDSNTGYITAIPSNLIV